MKICITGGLGYIGGVLVPGLKEKGHEIIIYDKGLFESKPESNVIKGDIRDYEKLDKTMADCDAVIHLAALVGEPLCDMDKTAAVNINFMATKHIAEFCKNNNKKLIFASTCSVYGAQPDATLTEESEVAPVSVYGVSKVASEEAILRLMDSNFQPFIFRLGTLYGYSSRMRFDLVINLFIAKALQDKEITVFGGDQWRPLLHIRDIIGAFDNALKPENAKKGGIYNLGGENYQIKTLAEIIKEKIDCEVKIIPEMVDKRNYMVSSEKAKNLLNVEFTHDINFAIKETKKAFDKKEFEDFKKDRYSNAKSFMNSEEIRKLINEPK